jgi:hypothetical protein
LYSTPSAIRKKPSAAISAAGLSIFAKEGQPAEVRKGGHYKVLSRGCQSWSIEDQKIAAFGSSCKVSHVLL